MLSEGCAHRSRAGGDGKSLPIGEHGVIGDLYIDFAAREGPKKQPSWPIEVQGH